MEYISYAGIGSRETPVPVLKVFKELGKILWEEYHFILRSGHAEGADDYFEKGVDFVGGEKEIYLPWANFRGSTSNLVVTDTRAFDIAKRFHPRWDKLSDGAKKLQARNSHQILGNNLDTLADFVVCWTPFGSGCGGTGQAIRIAMAYNIPVFDAGDYSDLEEFKRDVTNYARIVKEYGSC